MDRNACKLQQIKLHNFTYYIGFLVVGRDTNPKSLKYIAFDCDAVRRFQISITQFNANTNTQHLRYK